DETELLVADACRPHVRRAQRVRLPVGRQLRDLGLIDVPGEAQLAGHRVVPSNDTRWRPAALTIEHLMPGDDDPLHDDGWRREGAPPWTGRCNGAGGATLLRQPDLEVGGAVVAEILARLPRLCVHCDQTHVEGSLDDAFRAGLAGGGVGVLIERDTATR